MEQGGGDQPHESSTLLSFHGQKLRRLRVIPFTSMLLESPQCNTAVPGGQHGGGGQRMDLVGAAWVWVPAARLSGRGPGDGSHLCLFHRRVSG